MQIRKESCNSSHLVCSSLSDSNVFVVRRVSVVFAIEDLWWIGDTRQRRGWSCDSTTDACQGLVQFLRMQYYFSITLLEEEAYSDRGSWKDMLHDEKFSLECLWEMDLFLFRFTEEEWFFCLRYLLADEILRSKDWDTVQVQAWW